MDLPRPRAAIVVTGTTADANGPWLARQLAGLGFQVDRLLVVGDRPADLVDALEQVAGCAVVVTSGALALPPVGTAPGLVLGRPGGPVVVVLPGPPRELQGMWPSVAARSLRFFDLPEPVIAQTLRELGVPADLEVSTCLRRSELEVDIRSAPGFESQAAALADAIVARHPDQLISADGSSTDELLARALLERGWFVATAESCTGGMVAARLTDRPGSSAYVAGGTVAYSNEAKVSQLDVSAETLAAHGAVSAQVARELADGARRRFGAAIGVGITGIAGPDGGSARKPVGYVCFCVTTDDGAVLARDPVLPGGRAEVRERATDLAMHLLLESAQHGGRRRRRYEERDGPVGLGLAVDAGPPDQHAAGRQRQPGVEVEDDM